ncbi:hypothetical protein C8Q78DRAFT_734615 [Trametes maxima]|nr:hypothetical protein C8Q78DRAFT_734615 [Trametes maxima]
MSAMVHPAGKRFLMRKSSNVENMPPTTHTAGHAKKAQALVSAREASRRRRARVVSGSVALRKVVQNAQRRVSKTYSRNAPVKVELVVEPLAQVNELQEPTAQAVQAAPTPADPRGPTLQFPRWLARPPVFPHPFDRANIDACGPELHEIPHKFILRGLDVTGHNMWQLVQGATFDTQPLGHSLPQELRVVIADHTMQAAASRLPNSHPTHVLAVWEGPTPTEGLRRGLDPRTGRRKIRLVPVHNIVLAAHCAKWFPMPANPNTERKRVRVNAGGAMGTELTLPVVPLPVPHIESFRQLLNCLYTHKVSQLLDELVPVQKPDYVFPTPENPNPQNPHYIVETGRRLGTRFQPWAIVGMLRHVVGLWQNACSLGVSDKRLWIAIDWAWDMLLTGLAFATGRPESVPRPQPKLFGPAAAAAAKASLQALDPKTVQAHIEQLQQRYGTPPSAA